ncbi:glycosyltransferase family 4 protein [Burkholderia cepacia]|uniref:glycosyltransferase family 4 protein n=1 Tax=Burkholderia cepacia TaxID=292 RepID=UPI00158DDEAE|nr:glycosyltransferase [Burkholderia cepacia]MCA8161395.1 glycosyltransferase [Burkholderia cepacia]MDN7614569.1 glycosyltransferase [Burkholderia cepacia]
MPQSPFILDQFPRESETARRVMSSRRILFDGNFKGDYSLAIVNRELGKAFGNLGVRCDFYPHDHDWLDDPAINSEVGIRTNLLYSKPESADYDIHIRNTWPPRADDMHANLNAYVCFAWEETELPANIVTHFNRHLDVILVTASFVKQAMILSGITIPIWIVGNGCDHLIKKSSPPDTSSIARRYRRTPKRFLHISSCFPRKGAELLVDAFCEEFGDNPEWELLIKTFPNPHNKIEKYVAKKGDGKTGPSNIKVINKSVAANEIAALYEDAIALVAPSRGEGFGLPFAEAMLYGLPVITTGFSGQTDFCNDQTSWLIDFTLQPSNAHVSGPNSLWAQPDISDLRRKLREAGNNPQVAAAKSIAAYSMVSEHFTWEKVAKRSILCLIYPDLGATKLPEINIDLVSTWQQVCGIATYAEHLYTTRALSTRTKNIFARRLHGDELPFPREALADAQIIRPWGYTSTEIQALCSEIDRSRNNTIWIQHHPGFFSAEDGARLMSAMKRAKYKTKLITLHNVKDMDIEKSAWLTDFDAIFVHTANDAALLSSGRLKNIYVIPHGILNFPDGARSQPKDEFTVGTFGFLYPHKKILNLLAAARIAREYIPNIRLKLLTAVRADTKSRLERATVETYIDMYAMTDYVESSFDFLEEDQIIRELSECNVLVFPYDESTESATGAGRIAVSTKRPLLSSRSSVLRDLHDYSHVLKNNSPEYIAETLIQLSINPSVLHLHDKKRNDYLALNDYESIANRYLSIISQIAN